MRSAIILVSSISALVFAVGFVAAAEQQGTYSAWGHDFTFPTMQTQSLDVTVATDKKTGHKMNLVKLKNGHMMALVPADRYLALMTTPDEDMLDFGSATGGPSGGRNGN